MRWLSGRSILRIVVAIMLVMNALECAVTGSVAGYLPLGGCVIADEQSDVDRAFKAFDSDRYDDTIKYAGRALAATSDPVVRTDAEELLILGIRWKSGDKAALKEAESLRVAIPEDCSERMGELNRLDEIIAELRALETEYEKAIADKQQIIRKYPGTAQAAEADLWIARYTLSSRSQEEGIAALQHVMREHRKSKADFRSRRMLALLYQRIGNTDVVERIWADAVSDFSGTELGEMAVVQLANVYIRKRSYDIGIMTLRDIATRNRNSGIGAAVAFGIGRLRQRGGIQMVRLPLIEKLSSVMQTADPVNKR